MPRRCIGHEVRTVVQPDGTLLVFDGSELVARHDTAGETRPIACAEQHYAEALDGKRWAGIDSDIEEAARRNLERLDLLGRLSEKSLSNRMERYILMPKSILATIYCVFLNQNQSFRTA